MQPLVPLRAPKLFNLRSDPFERAEHEAGDYVKWFVEHLFVLVPAQAIVAAALGDLPGVPTASEAGQLLGRAGPAKSCRSRKAAISSGIAHRERISNMKPRIS